MHEVETSQLKLQDYLSFGYLYLLLLGITRDAIYYGFLGVNIISYSSIMDVLLSPIAYLTKHPSLPLIFLIAVGIIVFLPRFHKKYREAKWYGKLVNVKKIDEQYAKKSVVPREVLLGALVVASMFIGTGVGAGIKSARNLELKKLKANDKITFMDGEENMVKIIGQNSSYVFYVREQDTIVSISPVDGIKRFEKR